MQAGFSKAAAIKAQLGTALAAIMGTGVALAFGKDEENAKLLLNFAAGGFVYVATVDVLPALLQNKTSLKQTVAEVLAFAAGVSMMVMVGWLE
jgi:zinc transporter 7